MRVEGFVDALNPTDKSRVLEAMHSVQFKKNQVVFHQGEQGQTLHIVNRGHFIVHSISQSGDRTALVVLGPGDVFGEMAVLGSESTRTATVTAIDKASTLALDRGAVDDLRRTSINVDRLLLEILTDTVQRLTTRQMELTALTAPERVIRRVGELLDAYPSGKIRLHQGEIAALCNTTRATVNATLGELKADGIMVQEGRSIVVLDADALRDRGRSL